MLTPFLLRLMALRTESRTVEPRAALVLVVVALVLLTTRFGAAAAVLLAAGFLLAVGFAAGCILSTCLEILSTCFERETRFFDNTFNWAFTFFILMILLVYPYIFGQC
jgi:4-hydroxybenzoate polyprenyltransferase